MSKGQKVSIAKALESVTYFGSRKPQTTEEEMKGAFCAVSEYRDGGIFVGHRFDSPKGVKIMTVTPQPTDHQIEKPGDFAGTCDIGYS